MNESPARGRPPIFTEELAIAILTRIVEGESLRSICRDPAMPALSTVLKWRRDNVEFAQQYTRAMIDRADTHHEDILEISDDARNDWMERHDPENPGYNFNGEHVQRAKLRVEARKWSTARMNRTIYGDHVRQELTGADGGPIATRNADALTDEQLMAIAAAGIPAKP